MYFGLNSLYHFYTKIFFDFQILLQDAFLFFLFPGFLTALFFLKWNEIRALPLTGNPHRRFKRPSFLFLFLAFLFFVFPPITFFGKLPETISLTTNSHLLVVYYGQVILGNYFLFLGIFGKKFAFHFKKEMAFFLGTIGLYLASSFFIQHQWRFFSAIILQALDQFFQLIQIQTTIDPETFGVRVADFQVFVGATCAGIYSLATFIFFFFASIFMLKKNRRLHVWKCIVVFLCGLGLVFLLNIIRIAIIILIGAYVSDVLAIELFHEYLSAIFLIGIFLLFLYKFFPWMLKPLSVADLREK